MTNTASVKLTSGIGIAGERFSAGDIITIPEAAAKDLLRRGKAVVATAEDEPEEAEADEPEAPKPGKAKK